MRLDAQTFEAAARAYQEALDSSRADGCPWRWRPSPAAGQHVAGGAGVRFLLSFSSSPLVPFCTRAAYERRRNATQGYLALEGVPRRATERRVEPEPEPGDGCREDAGALPPAEEAGQLLLLDLHAVHSACYGAPVLYVRTRWPGAR